MFRKQALFVGMSAILLFAGLVSSAQAKEKDDEGDDFSTVAMAGYGSEKVKICHKGNTITVSQAALPAHLAHGDTLGKCPPKPVMVTICHKGNTIQTPITESWTHMMHGDHPGKCLPKAFSWYYRWQGGGSLFSWNS